MCERTSTGVARKQTADEKVISAPAIAQQQTCAILLFCHRYVHVVLMEHSRAPVMVGTTTVALSHHQSLPRHILEAAYQPSAAAF